MSKKLDFSISLKLLNENFKKGINNVKNQLNNLKGWIASAFAIGSILDFTKSIASVGSAFQDQMARVKAVSGATKKEFEEMRKEAEKLGATTRYSATQAAEALENLVRNGLSAKDATKSLAKVLELAGSQAIDLAQAADIATAVMNGFGKSVEDLGRVNDILASTTANSATNVTDLAEALKNVAPIANLLGASMEEVCAAIGTLADVGIKGSQAGNALRGILNRLIKPTKQGQEALSKYGLSISEAEIKANGLTATLEKLSQVNMSLADQKALFGEEYGSTGAALLSNLPKYTSKKTTIEGSSGEAGRQFKEGQGEFKTAIDSLKSTWESFLNGIFSKTSGIFTGIVDGARSVVEELKKWSTWAAASFAAVAIAIARKYREIDAIAQQNIQSGGAHINLKGHRKLFAYEAAKARNNPNKGNNDTSEFTTQAVNKLKSRYEELKKALTDLEKIDKRRADAFRGSVKDAEAFTKSFERAHELAKRGAEANTDKGVLDIWERVLATEDANEELKERARNNISDINKKLVYQKTIEDELRYIEEEISKERQVQLDLQNKLNKSANINLDADKYKKDFQEEITKDIENQSKELEKQNSVITKIGASFKSFWKGVASFFKSAYDFLGGFWGIAFSLAGLAIKFWSDYKNEQNKVFKELKKEQKDIMNQYSAMETQVMSLIGVMEKSSKESAAWKAARDKLTSGYPELFKNMNLEQIYLKENSEEYGKLKEKIKGVIKEQREYMLNEHKRAAVEKLQADYQEKTEGLYEELADLFTGATSDGNTLTKEAAQIVAGDIRNMITSMLSNGSSKDSIIAALTEVFDKWGVAKTKTRRYSSKEDGTTVETYDKVKDIATQFYNKYQRYGESIESIGKLEVKNPNKKITEKINELVNTALEYFDFESKEITKTGKAKNQSDEEISSEIDNLRQRVLDSLVEDLKGISTLVDGKSALDYAKENKLYDKLLPGSTKGGSGGGGGLDKDQTPKQLYEETKAYIEHLRESGIIDENERRKRLLSALDAYISAIENERNKDEESINTLRELVRQRKSLNDKIEASAQAEEDMRKINEELAEKRKQDLEDDKERAKDAAYIKDQMNAAGSGYKINKWDKFNANSDLEHSLVTQQRLLEKFGTYSQDLQNIAGDKDEVKQRLKDLEGLKGEGVDALRKQLEKLIESLENADKAVENLDDSIQLRKARKELKDLKFEEIFNNPKKLEETFSLLNSIEGIVERFESSWKDMDNWERFLLVGDAIFESINTVKSYLDALKSLDEWFTVLANKKLALAAIEESTKNSEAVAAQTTAAAVVAAETEKTTAITGAIATQSAAVLAAKAAQTKAATIAMAAESTAAYAAIPFAGVGFAAAQIAEMEALIAAAAALPAFAEGGIVGGSKYIGDQNLARVNSGEMIINGSQQRKLWDAISNNRLGGNTLSGDVEFKISGQVLRGVLNNHDKKISKIK